MGYWVKKHGLTANGKVRYAPRGGTSKVELEQLIASGMTINQIAAHLEISESTVNYWLRKHGLKTCRGHGRRELALAALAAGEQRFQAECRSHGFTDFLGLRWGTLPLRAMQLRGGSAQKDSVKAIPVEEAGGRCVTCGYDRHPCGLQFHHFHGAETARAALISASTSRTHWVGYPPRPMQRHWGTP